MESGNYLCVLQMMVSGNMQFLWKKIIKDMYQTRTVAE